MQSNPTISSELISATNPRLQNSQSSSLKLATLTPATSHQANSTINMATPEPTNPEAPKQDTAAESTSTSESNHDSGPQNETSQNPDTDPRPAATNENQTLQEATNKVPQPTVTDENQPPQTPTETSASDSWICYHPLNFFRKLVDSHGRPLVSRGAPVHVTIPPRCLEVNPGSAEKCGFCGTRKEDQ
jgi:hypothetical protein